MTPFGSVCAVTRDAPAAQLHTELHDVEGSDGDGRAGARGAGRRRRGARGTQDYTQDVRDGSGEDDPPPPGGLAPVPLFSTLGSSVGPSGGCKYVRLPYTFRSRRSSSYFSFTSFPKC